MEKSKSISKNNLIFNSKHYNFKDRTGEKHITKQGYEIEIIEYFGSSNCTIKFDNGITLYNVHYTNLNRGEVGNPLHKSFYNIGYIGIGRYKTSKNGKPTKIYSVWRNVMTRGFCIKFKENNPSYKDVSVCEEWHNFQNFAQWFEDNYIEGFHLDKDILVKGNKIYSPETCCFVPQEINSFVLKCEKSRGDFPIGVSKNSNTFTVSIRIKNKRVRFRKFTTVEQAFSCYKFHKELEFKRVADNWKGLISDKTYNALYNYQVEITD